jgi:hypothetical protein
VLISLDGLLNARHQVNEPCRTIVSAGMLRN